LTGGCGGEKKRKKNKNEKIAEKNAKEIVCTIFFEQRGSAMQKKKSIYGGNTLRCKLGNLGEE
jgi:hypothetical protein